MKTFYILWFMMGFNHSEVLATLKLDTKEECEAAAIAMVDSYNAGRDRWQQLDLHRSTKCIEVEVK
jgi:hypothetical protein